MRKWMGTKRNVMCTHPSQNGQEDRGRHTFVWTKTKKVSADLMCTLANVRVWIEIAKAESDALCTEHKIQNTTPIAKQNTTCAHLLASTRSNFVLHLSIWRLRMCSKTNGGAEVSKRRQKNKECGSAGEGERDREIENKNTTNLYRSWCALEKHIC